jgi:ribosomal protein S18 acetylase RimI-like enzyme
MIENVSLRPATEADYEFGFQVKKLTLGPYIAETWDWKEDEQRDFYRREFRLDDAYVIVFQGTDVGWFVNRRTSEGQELHQVYILPEYQNRGIGSHLISEVITDAEREGLSVLLQVLKCNRRAKQLYDRLGFKVHGETDTHFLMRKESARNTE